MIQLDGKHLLNPFMKRLIVYFFKYDSIVFEYFSFKNKYVGICSPPLNKFAEGFTA